ncbi:MAG: TIM barrel protein [Verrucomicrobia bacterium]|nr:TIM barrel protein [Verrucomicrobiota bacterium]
MPDILDRLSLSTCWCSDRHTDGCAMVEEMVGLGFKRIELSHGIRLSLVAGILDAVEAGMVEISSVHNFCPLPGSVQFPAPNLYQPSASDPREADLWYRYSMQTLDFAVKVGADRVIMHSGSVRFFFWSAERRLEKWIEQSDVSAHELAENTDFQKRRQRAMKSIARAAKKTMPRIEENYKKLLPEAANRGLKLCLENREGLEEMPLEAEHETLLATLANPQHAVYWHDCGHAQIKHQFGLIDHRAHLEKMSPRLGGFHLHDVSESGRDHRPPGTGTVDFDMIAEFVRPEHTLVLELSPKLTVEEVLASRDHVAGKLG